MKLPGANKAIVSKDKLINYLLSETHPVGSSKAKFFRGLGFNEVNIDVLAKLLLHIARTNEIKNVRKFIYGTNYVVEGTIKIPAGRKVLITTVWFIKIGESRPSFATAYPV